MRQPPARHLRGTTPSPASEVKLDAELNDAGIARGVILPKVSPKRTSRAARSQVVRDRQVRVIVENVVPRLPGPIGDVGGPVDTRVLGVVHEVEHLEAELEVTRPFASERELLKDREVVVVDAGIAQVVARVGPDPSDRRNREGGCVNLEFVLPVLGIAAYKKARLLRGGISRAIAAEDTLPCVDTRDAEREFGGIAEGDHRYPGDDPPLPEIPLW